MLWAQSCGCIARALGLALVIHTLNLIDKPMPEAMGKSLEMYRSTDCAYFSQSCFEFNW